MVLHHLREKEAGWHYGLVINGLGAVLTFVVLLVLAITKFTAGAWAVLIFIPLLVLMFSSIRKHYKNVAEQLSLNSAAKPASVRRVTAIVLVSGIHKGVIPALELAQALAPDNVTAVTVDVEPEHTERLRQRWPDWGFDVPLMVLDSPYRSLMSPLLRYVNEVDELYHDDELLVILPEFVPAHWWEHMLHNQTGLLLKSALLFRKKVVLSVPYHLER